MTQRKSHFITHEDIEKGIALAKNMPALPTAETTHTFLLFEILGALVEIRDLLAEKETKT